MRSLIFAVRSLLAQAGSKRPRKVALATRDGAYVDADLNSAHSFAFYDVACDAATFVGLVGFSASRLAPSRAELLVGCDWLVTMGTEPGELCAPNGGHMLQLSQVVSIADALLLLRSRLARRASASPSVQADVSELLDRNRVLAQGVGKLSSSDSQ